MAKKTAPEPDLFAWAETKKPTPLEVAAAALKAIFEKKEKRNGSG
jgi:hypothetical protein